MACDYIPFKYSPLADGEIRVLHLQQSEDEKEELRCNIMHFKLESVESPCYDKPNLDFDSISYVWGRGDPEIIDCGNDQKLSITPNLARALQALRNPKLQFFQESRRLWVDAICS